MSTDEYQAMADCIRSGQVPEAAIMEIMKADPNFEKWYRDRYLGSKESRLKAGRADRSEDARSEPDA